MWGFWDSAHWRPQAAIAEGEDVTPNEAGEAYIRLIHEVTTILNLGIFHIMTRVANPGVVFIWPFEPGRGIGYSEGVPGRLYGKVSNIFILLS